MTTTGPRRLAIVLAAAVVSACASGGQRAERPPAPHLDERVTSATPDAGSDSAADRGRRSLPPAPLGRPASMPAITGLPAPAPSADGELYRLDDLSITEAALGDFLLRYFPDRVRDGLGQLLDEALVALESQRELMTIDAGLVTERAEVYIAERRREVRVQYGPDAELEHLLETRFGRDLATFQADAERLARVALLRDRLVRLDQLRHDRVELRVLVLATRTEAERVVGLLRGGADMLLFAEREGLRPPVSPPPLPRDEVRPPELAELAFAAAPGDVLEPLPFESQDDGRTYYQVVKVVAHDAAVDAPWEELAERVEADLSARPVGVPEYLAWRRRALVRHDVRVRRAAEGLVPWVDGAERAGAERADAKREGAQPERGDE